MWPAHAGQWAGGKGRVVPPWSRDWELVPAGRWKTAELSAPAGRAAAGPPSCLATRGRDHGPPRTYATPTFPQPSGQLRWVAEQPGPSLSKKGTPGPDVLGCLLPATHASWQPLQLSFQPHRPRLLYTRAHNEFETAHPVQ